MARELRGAAPTGNTAYARLLSPAGLWWTGAVFEAYAAPHYATYAVALAEQGGSGVYVADFPAAILAAGTYEYFVHLQAGGAPAEGDPIVTTGKVDWTGTAAADEVAGGMSGSDWRDYLLRKGFKRTDKDTELYEATTDAIQQLRERFAFDEAEVDAHATASIAALGDFQLPYEADLGLLLGLVLEDGRIATPLVKTSKAQFDELYPDIHVTQNRGYPLHYCLFGGQIYIGPQPDRLTFGYRLNYSKRAGAVTAATASVPFTALYRSLLAHLTLALLWDALDEPTRAVGALTLFEQQFVHVQRRERKNAGLGTFQQVMRDF